MGVVDLKTMNSSVFARIAHISELAMMVILSDTICFNHHLIVSLLDDLNSGPKLFKTPRKQDVLCSFVLVFL